MSLLNPLNKMLIVLGLVLYMTSSNTSAVDGLLDPELIDLYKGTNINPFDVAATNNFAIKLVRQGHYERGLKLFERAIKLAPGRTDIKRNANHLRLLLAQMENLDLNTALNYNRTFKEQDISFVPAPWGLSADSKIVLKNDIENVVAESVESSNPFDAQSLVTIANIKVDRGDYRGALTDLRRARVLSPWLSELDLQITQLESKVSELGTLDSSTRPYLPSNNELDELDNPEPPSAWSTNDAATIKQ